MKPLHELSATELSAAIAAGSVSCVEVMQSTLQRISRHNPEINALVSLRPEDDLLAEAELADQSAPKGWLHGVPLAIKDLADTAGLRTTYGSKLFEHHVPTFDAPLTRRLRDAGAIIIGKTNTPEFGLGSQTYNAVFGATRNPYNPECTAGGSSGGAAAALASRLLSVADGSDMMGSLRNPAAYCNVYGFRPSVGVVSSVSEQSPCDYPLATEGPMARTVIDVAKLLDTLGSDEGGTPWGPPLRAQVNPGYADGVHAIANRDDSLVGKRLGWLGNLDDQLPIDPEILRLCDSALSVFESAGAVIEPVKSSIAFDRLWQSWTTLRSASIAAALGDAYLNPDTAGVLKPEAHWEIERGLALSAMDVHDASVVRMAWYQQLHSLFEHFDALVLPSAQVFPFSVENHWPQQINGRSMTSYHEWMAVVVPASLAGIPALNVPVGFSQAGLPMGMQLLGKRFDDAHILQLGEAYHRMTEWPQRQPPPSGGPST